jgi:hypothetical protein
VAFEINQGQWLVPTEAAKLTQATTAQLRYWATHGLITTIHHEPGTHRRYLKQELEIVVLLTAKHGKPTMQLLTMLLDAMLMED